MEEHIAEVSTKLDQFDQYCECKKDDNWMT